MASTRQKWDLGGCLIVVDVGVFVTAAHPEMFLVIPAWLHLGSKVGFKGVHSASERQESSPPSQSPGGEWWLGQHEALGTGISWWGGLVEGKGCCWPSRGGGGASPGEQRGVVRAERSACAEVWRSECGRVLRVAQEWRDLVTGHRGLEGREWNGSRGRWSHRRLQS